MTTRIRSAAAVAGIAVIGLAVGGVAYADSSSRSGSPQARTAAAARPHPILRRLMHGQFVLRAPKAPNGSVTVDLQQGRVTAVSTTSITVRSNDGVLDTYVVTPKTKVRARGKVLAESSIVNGDHVFVVALESSGGTATARAIRGVTTGSKAG
jgi:hypothetical protein